MKIVIFYVISISGNIDEFSRESHLANFQFYNKFIWIMDLLINFNGLEIYGTYTFLGSIEVQIIDFDALLILVSGE